MFFLFQVGFKLPVRGVPGRAGVPGDRASGRRGARAVSDYWVAVKQLELNQHKGYML